MATDILHRVSPLSGCMRLNAEETYIEVENLIRKEVWRIIGKYGGDFDDLMTEASAIYLVAYDSFGTSSGTKFTTWLVNNLRWGLIDKVRNRINHERRFSVIDDQQISKNYRDWKPSDLIDELHEDAKLVAKLVLDTPEEIMQVYMGKGGQPRNFRSTIRDYLIEMGWTASRISESFAEIRQALKD